MSSSAAPFNGNLWRPQLLPYTLRDGRLLDLTNSVSRYHTAVVREPPVTAQCGLWSRQADRLLCRQFEGNLCTDDDGHGKSIANGRTKSMCALSKRERNLVTSGHKYSITTLFLLLLLLMMMASLQGGGGGWRSARKHY